ncbi:MAG: EutN/CcmL family microcompartment protein, partial [Candidatus Eiseniibacteriota bacterium]
MRFGQITGTVVATRKDERLEGLKLQVVQVMGVDTRLTDEYVVAADAVGAGIGEVVLFATGSSARQTTITDARPIDAIIMAIVDLWDVDGEVLYRKDAVGKAATAG